MNEKADNQFDHQMSLTMSQAQAEHLIELLEADLVKCANMVHMRVYLPLHNALEKQFKEQKL